jgi:hypothetical protein
VAANGHGFKDRLQAAEILPIKERNERTIVALIYWPGAKRWSFLHRRRRQSSRGQGDDEYLFPAQAGCVGRYGDETGPSRLDKGVQRAPYPL